MSIYIMAAVYIIAGILHLVRPRAYMQIMPPYLPAHRLLVILSGLAEVGLGIALFFPQARSWAAWGIILLLIAVFPANVYMAVSGKFRKVPAWALWLRLPLDV